MRMFDSPLEELFYHNLLKFVHQDSKIDLQVEFNTICGQFFADFVVTRGSTAAMFECDGRKFHDPGRDEWRDALILGTGKVTDVFRIRGCDLYHHAEDVFYLLVQAVPEVFSARATPVLERLACDAAKEESAEDSVFCFGYGSEEEDGRYRRRDFLLLIRRRLHVYGKREYWQECFEFASRHAGKPLDDVIRAWKREEGF